MIEIIYQFAIHTPWWVYLILAYLIFIGIKSSKPAVVSLKRMLIIPIAFTILSIYTLLTVLPHSIVNLIVWLLFILVGSAIGWIQIKRSHIRVDRERKLIWTEGNWTLLIILLAIFAAKYYFDYQLIVSPQIVTHPVFVFSLIISSAVLTGWFIGRVSCLLYRLFHDASEDLSTHINKD